MTRHLLTSTGRVLRLGGFVRVVGTPPRLHRETKVVFRQIMGRRFKVRDLQRVRGIRPPLVLAELDVSRVTGMSDFVYVEPEFLD